MPTTTLLVTEKHVGKRLDIAPHSLAPLGVPLYPMQLMEAGGEFLNFLILLFYPRPINA